MKNVKNLLKFFIDLVFPIECIGCGAEGEWLCRRCLRALKLKERQYCLGCKSENRYGEFCPRCAKGFSLNGVWIAGDYDSQLLSQAIKLYKYRFIRDLGPVLGEYLSRFLLNLVKSARLTSLDLNTGPDWRKISDLTRSPAIFSRLKDAALIPVPLHKRRWRWRGYNQSEPLAAAIAYRLGIGIEPGLVRIKHKPPQARLSEARRKSNIKDCFRWQGDPLSGRSLILVDDVTTTGSTLNECARVLKAGGAREVWGLVVAKG